MKDLTKRNFTQLGIHIEGLELDPKQKRFLEAGMASHLQKLLHEMDDINKYGFVRVIPELEGLIPKPFPFPHGIVVDIDDRLLEIINSNYEI